MNNVVPGWKLFSPLRTYKSLTSGALPGDHTLITLDMQLLLTSKCMCCAPADCNHRAIYPPKRLYHLSFRRTLGITVPHANVLLAFKFFLHQVFHVK